MDKARLDLPNPKISHGFSTGENLSRTNQNGQILADSVSPLPRPGKFNIFIYKFWLI